LTPADSTARPSYAFPKAEKLCRKKLIETLYGSGKAIKTPAVILVYMITDLPEPVPSQALFTVSRRNFKKAHDRNRIKRLMREGYRLNKSVHNHTLSERGKQAALMFIFTGRTEPSHDYVFQKISELLRRFTAEIKTS
jgi:ribonuclease P protein component